MIKKWINCNACGENSFKKLAFWNEWAIGSCGECGLVYVNPSPFFRPGGEFSEISSDFQYTQYQHGVITPAIIEFEKNQLIRNLLEIEQLTGRRFQKPMFLDVGCGSGGGVRAAHDLGWESVGIDIDEALIRKGIKELNVDLRCATLLESDVALNSFQFVRMRDVIEHLPNPYEVLLKIRSILASGGVLLVSTPNEHGLPTRLRALCGLEKKTVATVAPPHHLHGFCQRTLRRILDRADFEVFSIKSATPIDTAYVTSRNRQSAGDLVRVVCWHLGKMVGMGSMLVGWAGK